MKIEISEFDGPIIGSCGGDAFGTDGLAEIRVNGDFFGFLVYPWNDPWFYLVIGKYPNERYVDIRARTEKSARKKARRWIEATNIRAQALLSVQYRASSLRRTKSDDTQRPVHTPGRPSRVYR